MEKVRALIWEECSAGLCVRSTGSGRSWRPSTLPAPVQDARAGIVLYKRAGGKLLVGEMWGAGQGAKARWQKMWRQLSLDGAQARSHAMERYTLRHLQWCHSVSLTLMLHPRA